ncbi:hypothetical protein GCM10012275_31520 [Longimycelium tulufanense]|uniref:DUF2867 domain-containing protein n=2 Tax=Longimycelium tulufanense TaxID=907463 RepID=A0A8J3C950_9PSEU|nr:hypothetical protein GCM10012275_31520 [Longimycelium tulufanense]
MTAPELARRALAATPGWVRALLRVRDILVRPFGLHTGSRAPTPEVEIEVGRELDAFIVLSVSDGEVLLGRDDRHLRFRTSFAIREGGRGREGVCTTVVTYNNIWGRLYHNAIKPFHGLIIRTVLARGACLP